MGKLLVALSCAGFGFCVGLYVVGCRGGMVAPGYVLAAFIGVFVTCLPAGIVFPGTTRFFGTAYVPLLAVLRECPKWTWGALVMLFAFTIWTERTAGAPQEFSFDHPLTPPELRVMSSFLLPFYGLALLLLYARARMRAGDPFRDRSMD